MLRGTLYSLRMVSQLRIIGFHPTSNINQNSGGGLETFVASECTFEPCPLPYYADDVQYIHPPVSLASSCYQGILKIDLDMISYSHATLCLQTSSQAALGDRIHGLSCGEVVISLSGNGSASVHYCFFFDAYDSGNVTKRLCWRCWRLAV